MTDREAMFALAAPEPDYHDDPAGWQDDHDRRLAALRHAQAEAEADATQARSLARRLSWV